MRGLGAVGTGEAAEGPDPPAHGSRSRLSSIGLPANCRFLGPGPDLEEVIRLVRRSGPWAPGYLQARDHAGPGISPPRERDHASSADCPPDRLPETTRRSAGADLPRQRTTLPSPALFNPWSWTSPVPHPEGGAPPLRKRHIWRCQLVRRLSRK